MSEPKFTPGPWHWDAFPGTLLNGNGEVVAGEANNHLIAAAPDLYNALDAARTELFEHAYAGDRLPDSFEEELLAKIANALSKARGEHLLPSSAPDDEPPYPVDQPAGDGDPDLVPA